MRLRRVIELCASTMTGACLVAPPPSLPPQAPVTVPVFVDQSGRTEPRLGTQVNLVRGLSSPSVTVRFEIPVDDENVNDLVQFQFYVNADRDCVGGNTDRCLPAAAGEREPNGDRRRVIQRTLTFSELGCNRVELWVSSQFRSGANNLRTPAREGDFAFTTWYVYVKAAPGGTVVGDGGVDDPAENCAYIVPP